MSERSGVGKPGFKGIACMGGGLQVDAVEWWFRFVLDLHLVEVPCENDGGCLRQSIASTSTASTDIGIMGIIIPMTYGNYIHCPEGKSAIGLIHHTHTTRVDAPTQTSKVNHH